MFNCPSVNGLVLFLAPQPAVCQSRSNHAAAITTVVRNVCVNVAVIGTGAITVCLQPVLGVTISAVGVVRRAVCATQVATVAVASAVTVVAVPLRSVLKVCFAVKTA
jgi:hypothetical protein